MFGQGKFSIPEEPPSAGISTSNQQQIEELKSSLEKKTVEMASKVTGSDIDEKELEKLSSSEGGRSSIIEKLASASQQKKEEEGGKESESSL